MPTPTPSTAKMSIQAAAFVQKPALQKANPAEPGPTPMRPGAAPGAALSGAGLASAFGGEVLAKKAAVILPKPRVTPVQQPAVKHEEAVSAHTKRTVKREEAVPVQKPTVKKASPTPAVHRSGSGANLSRAGPAHALIAEVQAQNGVVYCYGFVEDEVLRTYFRRWLLPGYVGALKAWRETWAALRIPWKQCGDIVIIIISSPSRGVHGPHHHQGELL